ncbi:MAG TPA: hypothetical protein VHF92_06720 [Geodermatophilus sp.]|nr:hypothetical protein [Geodermatophilus sp.]
MTRRRVLAAAAGLSVVLLGAMACTGSGDDPADSASPSAPTTAPPTLAGGAEAEAVSVLPAGPATGTAVLAYSGVGELSAPFSGDCSHAGDATEIAGSVDTAQVRVEIAPDGARLALEDVGFSATSDLATGRYDVSGGHLSLDAPLAQDGQVVGSVQLEVDCGG